MPRSSGAEDRNRTGTVVSNRGILSPLRLPVPPPRQVPPKKSGAGDGNRTHVISLEGWSSTIELHPHEWSWREELNPQPADYKSAALPIELHQQEVVPQSGIEPLTRGFSVPCSTN